jgi:hypothetical protein
VLILDLPSLQTLLCRHFGDLVTALIGHFEKGDEANIKRRINTELQKRSADCFTGSVFVSDYKQHPDDKPAPAMFSRAGGDERSAQVLHSLISQQALGALICPG